MDHIPTPDPRRHQAEYIERMSQELSRLAEAANLPMLAYLLDMAAEEAAQMRGATPRIVRPLDGIGGYRRPRVRGHA